MDPAAQQSVLGAFSYGVYAVTVAHGGDQHAMTANWLTQASHEPPMLAVAVENTSRTIGLLRDVRHFVVNVFADGQQELAARLGRSSANAPDKLKGIKTKPAPTWGGPILSDALGWLECRLVATLPAGDHTLVLGEVVDAGSDHPDGKPLVLQQAGLKYTG